MNDGSALSGTYTLTNGSAIVQGNSSADTSEIKVGDIVIDDNGDKVRVKDIQPNRTVATSAVNTSATKLQLQTTVLLQTKKYTIKQMVELQSLV